jgi:hypothetical protein
VLQRDARGSDRPCIRTAIRVQPCVHLIEPVAESFGRNADPDPDRNPTFACSVAMLRRISRLRLGGRRGEWLWRGTPRTRTPPPRGRRCCHQFISAISRLRCGTRSPSTCGRRLGALIDIYRRRCCCWRHCRGHRCLWFATEPESPSQRRTALGISWGGERMIAPQSPTLQVFLPIEPVPRADMPSKRLAPIAAIQAHHVVLMNGSPHRHGRGKNFLRLNGLSNLTDSSMDCGDEVGDPELTEVLRDAQEQPKG